MNFREQLLLDGTLNQPNFRVLLLIFYILFKNSRKFIRIETSQDKLPKIRNSDLQQWHRDLRRVKDKLRYHSKTAKKSWEPTVEVQISQQKAIGQIAQLALEIEHINVFLQEVTKIIYKLFKVDYCGIFQEVINTQELLSLIHI